jgi:hypothetical protein
LLLLNSYCLAVGCPEDKLPYQVTAPRKHHDAEVEYMGFAHASQLEVLEVSNPTASANAEVNYCSDDNNEEDDVSNEWDEVVPCQHREQEEILGEQLGNDLDIEIFATEEEYNEFLNRDTSELEEMNRLDEIEDAATKKDQVNRLAIERELSRLLPTGNGQETTIEAFKRLTNQCEWIPFRDPSSSTPASDIDKAEAALYDEWMSDINKRYSLNAQSGSRTFKAFERDWNNEVTRRFRLWSRQGEDGIIQLRYKSKLLLQQHYNRLAEIASLQAQLPQDDEHRRSLDEQLRNNRRSIAAAPAAADTSPPVYNGTGTTPFGCPTGLNAEVAVGAIRCAGAQNPPGAPFRVDLTRTTRTVPQRPQRKLFRSRKYCVTCGFKRSEHVVHDEGVAATCTRSYCGKCRERHDCHGNAGFGLTCSKATHPWQATAVADWYATVT